jgi:FAD-dependent oxidoreductase domain-containing protein 1
MEQTNLTQKNAGAAWIDLLTPEQLSQKFPWLNTSGIALGSLGTQCEGYFDPWSLLSAMKLKVSPAPSLSL